MEGHLRLPGAELSALINIAGAGIAGDYAALHGCHASNFVLGRRTTEPLPEACFARPRWSVQVPVRVDRLVGKHQRPTFAGLELHFDGIENGVRGAVRRAELAALLEEAPGDEECALDGATNGHTLPTRWGGSRSVTVGERRIPPPVETQFFSTMRPTTLPARSSSIHFWTSPMGSSRIGVGLILPARASAINSWASASVPTMKPSTVKRL